MCRIAGVLDKSSETILADTIAMRDAMAHGGPDDNGIYYDEDVKLCLGHRRLSIIDLSSAGHQPMHSDNGNITIVFNGEIYNFRDIKEQLRNLGYIFKTQTDTEVIVKAYEHWGHECFSKLKGMFAVAIHDKTNNELILARDANGIKPLYYTHQSGSVYFASEIRAFKVLPKVWHESEYWKTYILAYGYLPEPHTTLKEVKMLAKGTCIIINTSTLDARETVFYSDDYSVSINDENEAVQAVRVALDKAVDRHLISDAPIGLFLSGGIDSSLLTLIAKQTGHDDLHTLSIIFNDADFSEEEYQNIIVKKTGATHKSFKLSKEIYETALPDIFKAMDQPTTDGINTYFICKYAKEYGLKAVLSGLGADELFGGYASFKRERIINRLKKIPKAFINASAYLPQDKYRKISFLSSNNVTGEYLFHRGFFSVKEIASILDADTKEIREITETVILPHNMHELHYGNKVSYLEKNLYMQSQLLRDTDMMSMWHSLEVRVPFLDNDLVNIVNAINPAIKYPNEKRGKHLLIKAYEDILPQEIWNRKKQGFVFPFQRWMKGNEDTYFSHTDKRIRAGYQSGNINWSRYWAYLVANNYNDLH